MAISQEWLVQTENGMNQNGLVHLDMFNVVMFEQGVSGKFENYTWICKKSLSYTIMTVDTDCDHDPEF